MKMFIRKVALVMCAAILATSGLMAQSGTGTISTGDLSPTSNSVTLKTVRALFPNVPAGVANDLFGGLHSVNTVAELHGVGTDTDNDIINDAELQIGMLVYVAEKNMYYRYKGKDGTRSNSHDNSNGNGSGAAIAIPAADQVDADYTTANTPVDGRYWESLSAIIYNAIKESTTIDNTSDVVTPAELTNGQISAADLSTANTNAPDPSSDDITNGDHFVVQAPNGSPLQTFVYNDGTWTLISDGTNVNNITNVIGGGDDIFVDGSGDLYQDVDNSGTNNAGDTDLNDDYKEGDVVIIDGNTYVYDGTTWTQINSNVVNTDDQTVDKFNLNGTTLEISLENDGAPDVTVDLSSLMDNTDNQNLTSASLDSNNKLTISIENGNPVTVDLSSLFNPANAIDYTSDAGITYGGGSISDDGTTNVLVDFTSVTYTEGDLVQLADGNTYVLNSDGDWMQISKDDYVESVDDWSSDAEATWSGGTITDSDPADGFGTKTYVEGNIVKLADGHSYAYDADNTKWVRLSKNADVTKASGAPSVGGTENEGDIYINSDNGDTYVFNETTNSWEKMSDDAVEVKTLADVASNPADVTTYTVTTDYAVADYSEGDMVKVENSAGDYITYVLDGTTWVEIASDITPADATTYDVYGGSVGAATQIANDATDMDDARSKFGGTFATLTPSGGVCTVIYPAIWGDFTYSIVVGGSEFEITNGITSTIGNADSDSGNSSTSDAGNAVAYKTVVIASGTYDIRVK